MEMRGSFCSPTRFAFARQPRKTQESDTSRLQKASNYIFSFRNEFHQWDPKNQRPELWDIYNARIRKGESIRVFMSLMIIRLQDWERIY